ncbi:hypothetical protein, partial [Neorhizobium sp. DT-125]|uniref:hypothetical protein n=1 Tax=Neorhizobium sp. DT-125 TaxID=3396163 RepID=UPI003F1A9C95
AASPPHVLREWMVTTIYTHVNFFRDHGDAWYGHWGFDKENACHGNGSSHDKSLYWLPHLESCSIEGGPVMAMTLVEGMIDPNLRSLEEGCEKNSTGGTIG